MKDIDYNNTLNTLFGIRMQQSWGDLKRLELYFSRHMPKHIIEIGTGFGALSLFFGLHAKTVTFDVVNKCGIRNTANIEYINLDIFCSDGLLLLRSFINQQSTFVFCDNGNKPKEFELVASIAPKGTLIGVHDVGLEITKEQLAKIALDNRLTGGAIGFPSLLAFFEKI